MILRIPARPGEPCPLTLGQVRNQAVPNLTGRPRIRVTAEPQLQRLGSVTEREAQGMNYRGRAAWRADWVRRHDRRGIPDEDRLRRFELHWANHHCWVITFDLVEPTTPKFLADQRRRHLHGDGQYHWAPSVDSLPVIDPPVEYAQAARERDSTTRLERARAARESDALARAERGRLRSRRATG